MTRYSRLFSESVIVTGTHYSMSTLMGQIIGAHSDFHLVHEPLKHRTTLSHQIIQTETWYEYFNNDRSEELARGLQELQFGKDTLKRTLSAVTHVRGLRDVGRVGKRALTGFGRARLAKRAVFKDPFLCFSARTLQMHHGLNIILTMRHPCGFAESLSRRGEGFDFANLMQPALLDALPEFREDIERFAREPRPIVEQAALLWKVVYGFAEKYYLSDTRTSLVRQEDFVSAAGREVDRVLDLVGVSRTEAVNDFLAASCNPENPVDFSDQGHAYTRRDAEQAAEKWRTRMGPADVDRVMALVGDLAGRFGYV